MPTILTYQLPHQWSAEVECINYFKDSSGGIFPERSKITPLLLPVMLRKLIETEAQVLGQEEKMKGEKKALHICSISPCVKCNARYFVYTLQSLVSSLTVNAGKLRLREVKVLAQDDSACKWRTWKSNPSLSGSCSVLLRKKLRSFWDFFSFHPKKLFTVKLFLLGRKLCKAFATAPTRSET